MVAEGTSVNILLVNFSGSIRVRYMEVKKRTDEISSGGVSTSSQESTFFPQGEPQKLNFGTVLFKSNYGSHF